MTPAQHKRAKRRAISRVEREVNELIDRRLKAGRVVDGNAIADLLEEKKREAFIELGLTAEGGRIA